MTIGASRLVTGPLGRETLRFGLPLAFGLALHGLFNLVDLIIIGRLPEGSIGAVNVAGVLVMIPMLFFDGVSNVAVALSAQAFGARRKDLVHQIAVEMLVLALLGTVVSALVDWPAELALRAFDLGDAATISGGISYLRIMMLGSVTMFLIMVVSAMLRGVGDSRWPTIILIGANVLNLILCVGLVFGKWGFPEMGVVGAAWATVIARGVGAVVGVVVLLAGGGGFNFRLHPPRRPLMFVRTLLLSGLPGALQLTVRVGATFALLKLARDAVGGSPAELLDGVGIATRLEMVAVFIALGWGAAATTIVGQNLGAREPDRAARGAWWLVLHATVSMMLVAAVFWGLRDRLFELVMPGITDAGRRFGMGYWSLLLPAAPVIAVGAVLARALNGATSNSTPLIIDTVGYLVVLLPVALVACRVLHAGPAGAWWSLVGAHVLVAVVYVIVFLRGRWRTKARVTASAGDPYMVA